MTILMIVTLIPLFLHCLCTSASNINILIDRFKLRVCSFGDVNTICCQTASNSIHLLGSAPTLLLRCISFVRIALGSIESITLDKSIQTEFSRTLGLTEHYDDLEDLTTEKLDVNAKLRKEAIWKVSSGFFSVMH